VLDVPDAANLATFFTESVGPVRVILPEGLTANTASCVYTLNLPWSTGAKALVPIHEPAGVAATQPEQNHQT
jgi:hypothetical protein